MFTITVTDDLESVGVIDAGKPGRILWHCSNCPEADDLSRGYGEALDALIDHYRSDHRG